MKAAEPNPPSRPGRAWEQLQTILLRDEAVVAAGVQHWLYALQHRRALLAATNQRLIAIHRPLVGGYHPFSIRWQDLRDVGLVVGPLTARLTLHFNSNHSDTALGEGDVRTLEASGMVVAGAQALYRACQAEQQAWREKRRIRSIEEMRAGSGGIQIANFPQPSAGMADSPSSRGAEALLADARSPAQRLADLREMVAEGLMSDAEFEAIKTRLVGGY